MKVAQCLTLRPLGLYSPWDFPGQNTGVGSHFLLQGVFPTQGSNLLWQVDTSPLSHQESPQSEATLLQFHPWTWRKPLLFSWLSGSVWSQMFVQVSFIPHSEARSRCQRHLASRSGEKSPGSLSRWHKPFTLNPLGTVPIWAGGTLRNLPPPSPNHTLHYWPWVEPVKF